MNNLISIVIPVYQSCDSLSRCIDSVLNQTFDNLEIILVDDGSNDGSGDICDKYAVIDKRVKVLHQQNGGVSKARNAGIDMSKGNFVLFVDSDDEILPGYVDSFVGVDVDKNKTLLFQGCIVRSDYGENNYLCPERRYTRNNFFSCLEENELFTHGGPTGKLYSMDIIKRNALRFDSRYKNYEDLLFFLDYIQYIEAIEFHSDLGYVYYSKDSGLHMSYDSFENECLLLRSYQDKTSKYVFANHKDKVSGYSLVFFFRSLKALYLDNTIYDKKDWLRKHCEANRELLGYSYTYVDIKKRIALLLIQFRCYGMIDKIFNRYI